MTKNNTFCETRYLSVVVLLSSSVSSMDLDLARSCDVIDHENTFDYAVFYRPTFLLTPIRYFDLFSRY